MNGRREHLWQQIQAQNAPTALSALDALDAAFLLCSFGSLPQAVFLFHHSVELAMKGLLESVDIILTADRPDFELLKWIARERIEKHPMARVLQVQDYTIGYDPKKTCNFEEAIKRVDGILRLDKATKQSLNDLNALRNRIVHFGDKDISDVECTVAILKTAWPFLKYLYEQSWSTDISMILRTEEEARELDTTSEYLDVVISASKAPYGKLWHTFSCAFNYNLVVGSGHRLFDERGWAIDITERRWDIYERAHGSMGWGEVFEPYKLSCRICHSEELIVLLDQGILYDPKCGFFAEALACMECSLRLDPTYKVLARLHYGEITKERVGEAVWADLKAWLRGFGSDLEYDPEILG